MGDTATNGQLLAEIAALRRRVAELEAASASQVASGYARSLIEVSPDPLVTISPQGMITDVNRATEQATGLPRKRLIGSDFSDYFTEPAKAREGYRQAFAQGTVKDYPLEIRHRDGHTTPVLYNASVYRDGRGEVAGVFAAARDITERVHAEEAVKTERQRLYNVLETLPAYVVLLTPDYHVSFANRFFRERFGESHGRRCFEYLFGLTEPCQNCETYKTMRANAPQHWEWTGPDGRIYDIHDYPFKDVDGSPLILELGIDITERKQAESALKEANETLERRVAERTAELQSEKMASDTTIESLPGIFYLFDSQGRLLKWNKNFERVSGYSPVELSEMHSWDFFVGEDRRLIEERVAEVFTTGTSTAQARFTSKDGHSTPYFFTGLLAEIGHVNCLIGMGMDITERVRAEEALRKANDELDERVRDRTVELRTASLYTRSLIEASLDPLVTISPQGVITDVNEATEQATGVPRERLIGSDFSDYFTEPQKAREGYQQVIAEGLVRDYPLTIRHTSGHTMDVLYNAAVYRNEAGELQGVFAAARDVTERKRAEEALERQTRELQRSNADLQQFAYVASHDLQEPLRMVASFTQLLQRRYAGKLGSDADEFIGYAVDGATRMQRMINDLLIYSRVNTRGTEFQPVALEETLSRASANLRAAIAETGAVVTHDPLPVVPADPTQMEQLLQNLIGNAVKFHGDDPPRIHVSVRRQRGEWLFAVKDNGIGIASEYQDRIFIIFQRLHSRDRYPGSGIGLAVCKRIVERHGGRLWVQSVPGKGSTFYFTIPEKEIADEHR